MADEPAEVRHDDVVARVRARVLAFARSRLVPADAEDLTQDVLVLLSTKYAHVIAPEELVALGVRILANKMRAHWRKAARRRAAGDAPAPDSAEGSSLAAADGTPDPEVVAQARQRLSFLVEAAAQLDGRCREIWRRKMEDASLVEIAAELGRPVNTVYSWDNRCRKRLRALLGDRWGFVSGQEDAR